MPYSDESGLIDDLSKYYSFQPVPAQLNQQDAPTHFCRWYTHLGKWEITIGGSTQIYGWIIRLTLTPPVVSDPRFRNAFGWRYAVDYEAYVMQRDRLLEYVVYHITESIRIFSYEAEIELQKQLDEKAWPFGKPNPPIVEPRGK